MKKTKKRKRPVSGILKLMGTPMFKMKVQRSKKGKGSYKRKNHKSEPYDFFVCGYNKNLLVV